MNEQELAETLKAWDEQRAFFRYQPSGLPLAGHTAVCSDDSALEDGYVFAYSSLAQVVGGLLELLRWAERDLELIAFLGTDSYDPGDVEGVAVLPVAELGRVLLMDAVHALGWDD